MKTIPRNRTRVIAEIKAKRLTCRMYSLRNDFAGTECEPEYAWDELERYHFARLVTDDRNGGWKIRVHGNLWYELAEQV